MSFVLGVFDGGSLVPSPKRTHRTPDSFWVTFDDAGKARYGQGDPPENRLVHGPFDTRYAAKKYVAGLVPS